MRQSKTIYKIIEIPMKKLPLELLLTNIFFFKWRSLYSKFQMH